MLTFAGLAQGPQDQVARLLADGHYLKAKAVADSLIEQASHPNSGAGIPHRVSLYQLLGMIESGLGRSAEAQRALERGIKLYEQQPDSAETLVAMLVSLSEAHAAQAHYGEADRALRLALTTAKAELGPDHPRLAAVFDGFGYLQLAQGQSSRAEQSFRRAIEILKKHLGPAHRDVAAEELALASLLLSQHRPAEAIPLIRQSREVLSQTQGSTHPDTLFAELSLGVAQIKPCPVEAEIVLRAALAKWLATQPEQHPTTARFFNAIAAARLEQGDAAEAIALSARGLDIFRRSLSPEHPEVVTMMYERARLLRATKRGKEAAALKKEADRIRQERGYPEPGRHSIDINALRGR